MADEIAVNRVTPGPFQPVDVIDLIRHVQPYLKDASGRWTPFRAAARLYDKVQIRTNIAPDINFDVASLDAKGPPSPWMRFVRPTITMSGPIGTRVAAPYGEATPGLGRYLGPGLLIGTAAIFYALGVVVGRRRKP